LNCGDVRCVVDGAGRESRWNEPTWLERRCRSLLDGKKMPAVVSWKEDTGRCWMEKDQERKSGVMRRLNEGAGREELAGASALKRDDNRAKKRAEATSYFPRSRKSYW